MRSAKLSLLMAEVRGFRQKLGHLNGMTILQLAVLDFIEKRGKVTITSVAQEFGISVSAASSLVGRLQTDGYLTKVSEYDDRRNTYVILTLSGVSLLDDTHQIWEKPDPSMQAC